MISRYNVAESIIYEHCKVDLHENTLMITHNFGLYSLK